MNGDNIFSWFLKRHCFYWNPGKISIFFFSFFFYERFQFSLVRQEMECLKINFGDAKNERHIEI